MAEVVLEEAEVVAFGGERESTTLDWSNGQVKGQINRLKTLKRQIYGRANLDLLERRFVLAA